MMKLTLENQIASLPKKWPAACVYVAIILNHSSTDQHKIRCCHNLGVPVPTTFTNPSQIWHETADPWSTHTWWISSDSVHCYAPVAKNNFWQIFNCGSYCIHLSTNQRQIWCLCLHAVSSRSLIRSYSGGKKPKCYHFWIWHFVVSSK